MANAFPTGLSPSHLWMHFDLLRQTPRPSGAEGTVREALIAWAEEHGLAHKTDATGNLLVRAPASPGHEGRPPVLIQGHIDMVTEKDPGRDFDFHRQGIDVELDGEFLTALGTTLGADNGIGVAAGMAAVTDPEVRHPPLELLFTIDEERGMTGAFGLKPGFVTAKRMLNLDTEEEGAIYVGCAGGGDVVAKWAVEAEAPRAGAECLRLEVDGLLGGHSGLNIDENRANAIKLLARVLNKIGGEYQLAGISGGSMRNAIPRHAQATLLLPPARASVLRDRLQIEEATLKAEFSDTDPELKLKLTAVETPAQTWSGALSRRLVSALLATPSSVLAMSGAVPGLVETSNNLGVIAHDDQEITVTCCTRSSVGSALEAARQSLAALYRLAGGAVELEPSYPGWQPDLSSELLKVAQAQHEALFGAAAEIKAVHAGLECGLIGEAFPGMEMISIGPNIFGAHSPSERVSVPSTERFYTHLKGILAAL